MTYNPKVAAGLAVMIASVGLMLIGQPSVQDKIERRSGEFDAALQAREVQIDPGELVELMHNNQVRLEILDVRDEADFNVFHLMDAKRVTLDDLHGPFAESIHPEAVVILVSNGEQRATEAWKLLKAATNANAYVLEGGINQWIRVYGSLSEHDPILRGKPAKNSEVLNYRFSVAVGDRDPISWPDPHHMELPEREFTPKAKVLKAVTLSGGGCG